ncbi:ABC transporter substrate-binding protein [Desulfobaculum bizertense]|uniref:ABC transporter substrate-binding protein n=1 Tax=Desulfobaculum bizertense TaxID=376490 RepID=UPI001F22F1BD|nr:ABC transporter substrate-binding protein [Desulfobaculum bizertense]UIJ38647.1 ABC transporter substrate-binding protein [Desulfobaculum bizertense]
MKKGLFGSCLLAVFCACTMLMSVAHADESLRRVEKSKTLRIGFCAQYPPFESRNDAGELEGFDVALGRALAQEMGVKAEFFDAEWQGLLAGLNKGDYDVLMSCMSRSETRGQAVNMSATYYRLPDVIVVRKGEKKITGLESLKGRTVGVQLGSGTEIFADKHPESFGDIKKYNYNPEAFNDLKFGRIDAVLVGYAFAVLQIKADSSYEIAGEPLTEAEIVAVMPKGADALTVRMNDALKALQANGTYDRIIDQWLSTHAAK